MRPEGLSTKIFLDSGDPKETTDILTKLQFLDGQTTNPSLVAKNPDAKEKMEKGEKFGKEEVYEFYKSIIQDISTQIPQGSVSIEVYADHKTTAEEMIQQAREMYIWIPNAHMKLPTTKAGLEAASILSKEGVRINMTLVFSQAQAAAVHAATKGASKGDIFLSPFIGRLDDIGQNGMDLIKNIVRMYEDSNSHVEILTASVRSVDHALAAMQAGTHIITIPYNVMQLWHEDGLKTPDTSFVYTTEGLAPIPYERLDITQPWNSFNIEHELTTKGINRFVEDWNALIEGETTVVV